LQELTTDIRFACRSPTKTFGQQSGLVLHRARHLFIRQQTSVINAIRAHLAEFGIVAPVGRHVALLDCCTFRDQAGSSSVTGCQRLVTIAAHEADAPIQQTKSTLLETIIYREICG
jgi:transposase